MSIRVLVLVVCVLFCGIYTNRVNANHIGAVNITYVGIDAYSYLVTVRYYRDCRDGNKAQAAVLIEYASVSCGLSGSFSIPYDSTGAPPNPGSGTFIVLPCLGLDSCDASPNIYGVEEFVYTDTVTLLDTCSDWILSFVTTGDRVPNDVMVNSGNEKVYVEALINNIDAPGNSSPDFIKPPIAVFCTNRNFFFNQGAVENDGDSLVYSLSQPQGLGGALLPFFSGFSAEYPFNVLDSPLVMEPSSGVLSFTPIAPAVISVMSVLIEEYNENGTLIGSIKNDMQVVLNDNCTADTLNIEGDTTVSTSIHPAISAECLDISITIHFDNPLQCETISLDGSDLILIAPNGDQVPISQVVPPICTVGLIDSLVIILEDSMRFNGSYFLFDTIGTDFIPILSECGLRLNDTLEIRLRDCVKARVDLLNVTVVNNSFVNITWSKYTENFQAPYFYRYDIYRSIDHDFGYDSIASIYDIEDTVYSDVNVSVADTAYNYLVKMILDPALLLVPISDSIESILLKSTLDPLDTNIQNLLWTRYWGWDNATYELLERIGEGIWNPLVSKQNMDTSHVYVNSLLANSYRLMIRSTESFGGFISFSNWIDFEIPVEMVPNVITPNGDGVNDFFMVNELLLYEPIDFIVFNRWGAKVFEKDDYQNNWDGDNFSSKPLEEGTYYYILRLTGAEDRAGFVTIIR